MIINRFVKTLSYGLAAATLTFGTATAVQAAALQRPAASAALSPLSIVHTLTLSHRTATRSAIAVNTIAYPLNGPFGLTIAPNGDLYVANLRGGNVLVFGSNLVQKPAADFAAGLTYPTAVAFDSTGEVYVSNVSPSCVNVYAANHTYLPARTISANVNYPTSIAIDGLDNLYVDSNAASIGTYDFSGRYIGNGAGEGISYAAIAQHAHLSAFVGSGAAIYTATNGVLGLATYNVNNSYFAVQLAVNNPTSVAFDAYENLYVATSDPAIVRINPNSTPVSEQRIVNLGFVPQAVAVDSAHNRMFIADFNDNAIVVYTLAGQFITTLH